MPYCGMPIFATGRHLFVESTTFQFSAAGVHCERGETGTPAPFLKAFFSSVALVTA